MRGLGPWMWLAWLVCTALTAEAGRAATASLSSDVLPCRIKRWTTEDGLPQNRIACLQQTRDGYLWIGTWFGLVRFDGLRFVVFNRQNTPALASDAISALAADADGTLWIATRAGLVAYAAGKFSRYTTADGLPSNDVWKLAAAQAGGVWLEAGSHVALCRQDRFRSIWQCPPRVELCGMEEDAAGRLNVFLEGGWLDLSTDGTIRTNLAVAEAAGHPASAKQRIWYGLVEQPGVAVVSLAAGLARARRSGTNGIFLSGVDGPALKLLTRDRCGRIWAQAQEGRLLCVAGSGWQDVNLGEWASDMVCASFDLQGNLWIGTEAGLLRLEFPKVRMFGPGKDSSNQSVWTVCEAGDGAMWLGADRGLWRIEPDRITRTNLAYISPDQAVRSVWPAEDGSVWVVAAHDGLLKCRRDGVSVVSTHGIVRSLYEDRFRRLWSANIAGSLHCFRDGTEEPLPSELAALQDVTCIMEDRTGAFWFGLVNGTLVRWQGCQTTTFTTRDGLPANSIWCIEADSDNVLWLGTAKGLVRCGGGRFFHYTATQRLPDDSVNWILEDDSGCLWFSTLHGIYRVSRVELNAAAGGSAAPPVRPLILGTADGMATAESNGENEPAGWKARDGRLWFATGKGAAVIEPKLFGTAEPTIGALIESVWADGQPLIPESGGRFRIPAGSGHALAFRYTACDLTAPEQVRFRTRLKGVDRRWTEPTAEREADYYDLPPGNYRLEILAVDHGGGESLRPTAVEFSVAPRFWQTYWFYGACGLVLIGSAAGIQGYRLRWQHRLLKLEQERILASERARIARDLHDDLGTALTGMALELDVLGRENRGGSALVGRLARSSQHLRLLAQRMREVVWVVNPRCDNLQSLADFLEDQATLLLQTAGLKVHLEFPAEIPDVPVEANVRHQLALSVREAFTNVIRHARASRVSVCLDLAADRVQLRIRDNGCGFDPQTQVDKPHGLMNLRTRLEEIGGVFEIKSAAGCGTEIVFTLPWSKLKAKPA